MNQNEIPTGITDVTVIGYANKSNLYVNNWINSVRRSNFDYQLLGKDEKWTGLVTRIKAYLKYLEEQPIDEFRLYVFIDVYDVIAIGQPQELMEKWLTFGTPIIIGAEPNCNPNLCRGMTSYWDHWNMADRRPNIYLNFGLVAGIRPALLSFFQYLIADAQQSNVLVWNEQISASHYLDLHPGQVALDSRMQLIGNMICHLTRGNVSQFSWSISKGRVYYTFSSRFPKSQPIFIHAPSKGIDALQRYNNYGYLILGEQWLRPGWDMLAIPGYLWVWAAIIVAILILWAVLGSQEWIITAFVIAWVILILYVLSARPYVWD